MVARGPEVKKKYFDRAIMMGIFMLFSAQLYAADAAPSVSEKRRATLKFGIDQDVKDLLKALDSEKNDEFNNDILEILSKTRNLGLKRSIFDFFNSRQWKGAELQAVDVIKNRGLEEESIVIGALNYAAAIKSQQALSAAQDIFTEREAALMPSLIKLSGRAGGAEEEKRLLAFFENEECTEANKQDIVLALGDIGSQASVEFLIKLVEDSNGKKFMRMYACDSLARLGKVEAVPALIKAANDADPNVRVYAVSSLGKFDSKESKEMIIEALRDSYDGVRIAAAKSVGSLKISDAEEFLRYKAENDKTVKVKEESFKAMAEIGSDGSFAFLADFLKNRKNNDGLRVLALNLLLAKKRSSAYPVIRETIAAESKEKLLSLYQRMAKEVAESESPELGDVAMQFLNSPDFIVRLYGIAWAKKNKAPALKPRLEELKSDKVEAVKKQASAALESY
jgi:HEAT repeat protein